MNLIVQVRQSKYDEKLWVLKYSYIIRCIQCSEKKSSHAMGGE